MNIALIGIGGMSPRGHLQWAVWMVVHVLLRMLMRMRMRVLAVVIHTVSVILIPHDLGVVYHDSEAAKVRPWYWNRAEASRADDHVQIHPPADRICDDLDDNHRLPCSGPVQWPSHRREWHAFDRPWWPPQIYRTGQKRSTKEHYVIYNQFVQI